MGRGIQLACESCDFTATLREREPFAADAATSSGETGERMPGRSGYWQDELCGECRVPVPRAHYTSDGAHGAAQAIGRCPRCGGETMPFEVAVRELAEVCHSRVGVDLETERRARARIERAIALNYELIDALASGDTTTLDAIDTLSRALDDDEPADTSRPASRAAGPLAATHTLGDLRDDVDNAASLEAAREVLRARLADSAGYIRSLEACVEDESHLPGTPCPQCETGRLIHWPIWS